MQTDPSVEGLEQPDAWLVRANFLKRMADDQAILAFLNSTGQFSASGNPRSIEEFRLWQAAMTKLLAGSDFVKTYWTVASSLPQRLAKALETESEFPMSFEFFEKGGCAILDARHSVLRAVIATIFVDKIRDTKIGFCERSDCGKPYVINSAHKRKFCEPYCGHLTSLREIRKMKRKRAKRTLKGGITSAGL